MRRIAQRRGRTMCEPCAQNARSVSCACRNLQCRNLPAPLTHRSAQRAQLTVYLDHVRR